MARFGFALYGLAKHGRVAATLWRRGVGERTRESFLPAVTVGGPAIRKYGQRGQRRQTSFAQPSGDRATARRPSSRRRDGCRLARAIARRTQNQSLGCSRL